MSGGETFDQCAERGFILPTKTASWRGAPGTAPGTADVIVPGTPGTPAMGDVPATPGIPSMVIPGTPGTPGFWYACR